MDCEGLSSVTFMASIYPKSKYLLLSCSYAKPLSHKTQVHLNCLLDKDINIKGFKWKLFCLTSVKVNNYKKCINLLSYFPDSETMIALNYPEVTLSKFGAKCSLEREKNPFISATTCKSNFFKLSVTNMRLSSIECLNWMGWKSVSTLVKISVFKFNESRTLL